MAGRGARRGPMVRATTRNDVAVSKDGKTVAFVTIGFWGGTLDAKTGKRLTSFQHDEELTFALAVAPDAKSCVTAWGGSKAGAKLLDLSSGKTLAQIACGDQF